MTATEPPPADIITPDQRIRVFVSSTLGELAEERRAVRTAIENLRLAPVMFELGARPHPPRELYRAYLRQSHVFVGIYHQRYGWVAPGESISGLEDEFRLSEGIPRLLYLKRPSAAVEPRLQAMLDEVSEQGSASYRHFADVTELAALVEDDLAALLSERFLAPSATAVHVSDREGGRPPAAAAVPLTPTVGREGEVAAASELLGGDTRLVTVTGPGGVGKTRLALEVARAVTDRFADGVAFVPLEDVPTPELVLPALAAALRMSEAGARPLLDRLTDELADRQLLAVMDNFEHLRGAGPSVATLLGRCPTLAMLVTTRQALRVRGEHEFPLSPLPTPVHDEQAPSMTLFVQAATAVSPALTLTDENRAAVADIVRVLDGLPLAIELAAAQTRLFPPPALAARLTQRLDVLPGGAEDLPARQRTLRATLDWSHQLLTPAEQALFARMSVFAGGATLDGVASVCGDESMEDVVEVVSSLLEKNLLVADAADEPRVSMLHVVRAYAAERLDERGEAERLSDRHARWCADLIEPADVLTRNDAPRFWPLVAREADNLFAAARWSAARGDVEVITALARRLWPWLSYTGRVSELRDGVPAAPVVDDSTLDDRARRQAFLHHAAACYAQTQTGDHAAALATADRALHTAGDAPDRDTRLLATSVRVLRAALRLYLAHTEGVAEDLDNALETARREDNAWLLGHATLHRGVWRITTADHTPARADLEEAANVATSMGNHLLLAQSIGYLATLDLLAGNHDEALRRLRRQIEHLGHAGSLEGLATALDTTAALAARWHVWETVCRAAASAEALRRRVGLPSRPITRELKDAAVQESLGHLGDREPAIRTAAAAADPWRLADEALGDLAERSSRA